MVKNEIYPELLHFSYAEEWYEKIIEIFDFDVEKDISARDLLYSLLKNQKIDVALHNIQVAMKNKKLLFFGAGPSIEIYIDSHFREIKDKRKKYYLIAADGSSLALLDKNLVPDLIFSDLDGLNTFYINKFIKMNTYVVIHAHGDNVDKIKSIVPKIKDPKLIFGTTQVGPRFPILNPGGFTDGDRSLYFCHHLCAREKEFYLIGYDFDCMVGKYSKLEYTKNMPISSIKEKKLKICKELIQFLQDKLLRKIIMLPRIKIN